MQIGSMKNQIIIVVTSIILAFVSTTVYRIWKYNEMVKTITISEPEIAKVNDGIYEGQCDLRFVYAKVRVMIKNHQIKDVIIIKHENSRGKKAELILDDVIRQQKLGVNMVTGATASSKALLKAVEDALR